MERWTIDVCKTCGRLATWPFCEHRPEGFVRDVLGDGSWCMPVVVKPAYPAQYEKDKVRNRGLVV